MARFKVKLAPLARPTLSTGRMSDRCGSLPYFLIRCVVKISLFKKLPSPTEGTFYLTPVSLDIHEKSSLKLTTICKIKSHLCRLPADLTSFHWGVTWRSWATWAINFNLESVIVLICIYLRRRPCPTGVGLIKIVDQIRGFSRETMRSHANWSNSCLTSVDTWQGDPPAVNLRLSPLKLFENNILVIR